MHHYLEPFCAASVTVDMFIVDCSGILYKIVVATHKHTYCVCVWFIHEVVIKEWAVDFIKAAGFFGVFFLAYHRKIWKSLNQIKPDFTLSYIDCMPEKMVCFFCFGITKIKKKIKKNPSGSILCSIFFILACHATKVFDFLFVIVVI